MTSEQWRRMREHLLFSKGGSVEYNGDVDALVSYVDAMPLPNEGDAGWVGGILSPMTATETNQPATVHIMHEGSVMCKDRQLRGRPCDWPPGHEWVSKQDCVHSTCDACKEALSHHIQQAPDFP